MEKLTFQDECRLIMAASTAFSAIRNEMDPRPDNTGAQSNTAKDKLALVIGPPPIPVQRQLADQKPRLPFSNYNGEHVIQTAESSNVPIRWIPIKGHIGGFPTPNSHQSLQPPATEIIGTLEAHRYQQNEMP
ncbi:10391_t:CDS:2 [Acaulospora colombiana]|uniref:10391_t:CDS:1 n=1 Tax=Acaulospora colombiana TaxID=27376 RepID=A0ACA9MV95_9GLOM|nr:10391_t:CDS:2 [Acaulospora colombiana]